MSEPKIVKGGLMSEEEIPEIPDTVADLLKAIDGGGVGADFVILTDDDIEAIIKAHIRGSMSKTYRSHDQYVAEAEMMVAYMVEYAFNAAIFKLATAGFLDLAFNPFGQLTFGLNSEKTEKEVIEFLEQARKDQPGEKPQS
jgi:hypothetical protein